MPKFTPLSFSLPKAPSRQVIHSLDKYSFKEVLELKKTEDNFINVIHPQKKKTARCKSGSGNVVEFFKRKEVY